MTSTPTTRLSAQLSGRCRWTSIKYIFVVLVVIGLINIRVTFRSAAGSFANVGGIVGFDETDGGNALRRELKKQEAAMPQNTKSKGNNSNKQPADLYWNELSTDAKKAAELLGYSQKSWDEDESPISVVQKEWQNLDETERQAAKLLGLESYYTAATAAVKSDEPDVTNQVSQNATTIKDSTADGHWKDLSTNARKAAKLLGYTQRSWDEDESMDVFERGWQNLNEAGRQAAKLLGLKSYFQVYNEENSPYETDCEEESFEGVAGADGSNGNKSNATSNVVEEEKEKEEVHGVGGLNCVPHGGPSSPNASSEMIWWHDIYIDAQYKSPFFDNDKAQYLTYEQDGAGFNNARMGIETVIVLAAATGRTLVLPPPSKFEHLGGTFSVHDFFPLNSLMKEHDAVGIKIISMEEFLRREGITGNLRDTASGKVWKPPANIVDWTSQKNRACLWEYLRSVGNNPRWSHTKCVAAIPASRSVEDINALREMEHDLNRTGWHDVPPLKKRRQFWGNATPVDAHPIERLRELVARRRKLCIYNEEMQKAPLVHLSYRLLTHFYTFLFFQDWRMDLYYKRYSRDHIRYTDDIMCGAARVVEALREKAREVAGKGNNPDGTFDTLHIRRGDFAEWYDIGDFTAKDFFDESANELTEGSTVYIATDEKDKTFFDIFKERYHVHFLDDFQDLVEGIDPHHYGMIDQVVAAKGRIFFGSYHSTFSGYANRIRGYYSTKHKLPGYKDGSLQSYYYTTNPGQVKVMRQYTNVELPVWLREFPIHVFVYSIVVRVCYIVGAEVSRVRTLGTRIPVGVQNNY